MPNPRTAERQAQYETPNARVEVELTRAELPLHCPMPGASLWNSHPRVYLPIEDSADRQVICPYCGTKYRLKD